MSSPNSEMFDQIDRLISESSTGAIAQHHGVRLESAFQAIYSLSHCRIVGYEGLLRATDPYDETLSPYEVFSSALHEPDIVLLDRLSRALHMRNFCRQNDQSNWLFLNVNPQVIVQGKYYGSFFKDLLDQYAMPPERIVVEIIEGAIGDESLLSESVKFYKDLGCLVAIDDFGAGHSNFERVWRLGPDIVKLDRSVIVQAVNMPIAHRVLPSMVSLIHEAGSLVLIEGVETTQEAMIAMDTDVDLVQGNFFSEPSASLESLSKTGHIEELLARYRDKGLDDARLKRLRGYSAAFSEALVKLREGLPIDQACAPMMLIPGADRCYLLNEHGIQTGNSLVALSRDGASDARFHPLSEASGANWFRRPYLRRALQHPRELQVTRPYLSIATGQMCITISMALPIFGRMQVLCFDVDWGDH